MIKSNVFLLLVLLTTVSFSQKEKSTKLGQLQREELLLKKYKKDTLANAVVLYEHANLYLDEINDLNFRTDFYYRIKLFNKASFDKAIIKIPLYKNERAIDIRGITYTNLNNGKVNEVSLKEDQIFTTKEDDAWKTISFTLPNLQEGCVVEFVYSVLSPYSQIDDWYFQSDIPKIKSEYNSSILGNYRYNTRLIGFLKLSKDSTSVKKNCVYVSNVGYGDCSVSSFKMDSIPAFKEEDYMLSKENFISKLTFDLISFTDVKGNVKYYTKTWKHADESLKIDFLDGQTSKKKFFKKKLSKEILSIANLKERAQRVYQFTQHHYTWNQRYWTRKRINIKKNFTTKIGGVDAINLALYNSLQAAEIESYLVMLSTRSNGLPTKLYPITKDFNYVIVKAIIAGKSYFLDATNKFLPFGTVPYKCLNGDGRVLDFKKESYWEAIKSAQPTKVKRVLKLVLTDEGFKGKGTVFKTGYFALNTRQEIAVTTEEEYLENFESQNSNLEVVSYHTENLTSLSKPLLETFEFIFEEDFSNFKTIRINPFFIGRETKNPFKLNKREYPVDFGFTREKMYLLTLKIPDSYIIKKIPKEKAIRLPDKGGSLVYKVNKKGNTIQVFFRYTILKKRFSNVGYFYLKEFFKQIIKVQNSYIEIEKK